MTDLGHQGPGAACVPAGCDDNPVGQAILLADSRVAAERVPVRSSAVTVTVHPSLVDRPLVWRAQFGCKPKRHNV